LPAIGAGHFLGHVLARQHGQRLAAAIFIASLIVLARTSSAPRKMKGKPRTLLTWLG
jgi:hypothetical protein